MRPQAHVRSKAPARAFEIIGDDRRIDRAGTLGKRLKRAF